jgi:hypothetical protein
MVGMRFQVGNARGGVRRSEKPQIASKGEIPVRVKANSEKIRKYIFHPIGRRRFNAKGYADWPNDSFTANRVRDGDVTIVQRQAIGEQHADTTLSDSADGPDLSGSATTQPAKAIAAPTSGGAPAKDDAGASREGSG